MEIQPIEDFLKEMLLIELRCLIPDRDTYGMMLLQPDGPIEGSENRIGHQDQIRGQTLCRSFLQKGVQEHADLLVTPEYCMPWTIIEEISAIDSKLRPSEGAIWVLGAESITLPEFDNQINKLKNNGHFICHENISPETEHLKKYLDPLLYVFWCSQVDGQKILCFVTQFKTTPSRDILDVEQRSLILGKRIYTFNRGINKIGLMSIICSDAFDFTDTLVAEYSTNMLLIHIQLNQKPAHKDYSKYRTQLISIASENNVELLCLNWAGNVVEISNSGKKKAWKNNAGSALYITPKKFNAQEETLINAHRNGLYYSLVKPWHAMFLNQEPHAILLQKQKVCSYGAPQSLSPKTCATVAMRWKWTEKNASIVIATDVDDGFRDAMKPYPNLQLQQKILVAQSPISVERAFEMLVGAPKKSNRWFEIDALESMHVADSETLRRVTVNQDFEPDSQGVQFRKLRLQRAEDAVTLPGHDVPWPPPLTDLENGFTYRWTSDEPHHNVYVTETGRSAGLVFLGDQSDDEEVRKVFEVMKEGSATHATQNAIKNNLNLQEAVVRCCDRLCVVFRRNHKIYIWGVDRISRFDRPPTESEFNFTREGI